MKLEELWEWISGYEGIYEVSNLGNIRSYAVGKVPKPKKSSTHPQGYQQISLSKTGQVHTFWVHRLVAKAFLPNPYDLPEVNHLNCKKSDNRASNLEWCTPAQNIRHGWRNGLMRSNPPHGENSTNAKLTAKEVLEIRRLYATTDIGLWRLSKQYKVSQSCIRSAIVRESWAHI